MRRTLKNKAAELSTLCGIDIAYVCFEPNYKVDLWSEDHKSSDTAASSSSTYSNVFQNDFDGEVQILRTTRHWLSISDVFSQQELDTVFRFSQQMEGSIFSEMERLKSVDETLRTRLRTIDWFRVPKTMEYFCCCRLLAITAIL
ncbi:hypothetical protein LINPERHAP2_LOCUS6185 [Linum perenne]